MPRLLQALRSSPHWILWFREQVHRVTADCRHISGKIEKSVHSIRIIITVLEAKWPMISDLIAGIPILDGAEYSRIVQSLRGDQCTWVITSLYPNWSLSPSRTVVSNTGATSHMCLSERMKCVETELRYRVNIKHALDFKDLVQDFKNNIKYLISNLYIDCMLKWKYFGYTGLNKIYY